ncbi:MAG TPA: M1 family metallopeptidase [Longimicrobium sp.]|nr:M1 family metallopeptidase [Longimicrobium sp.]
MFATLQRAALGAALALALAAACAPVSEPIIAPVPQGAAGDTAPRPLLQPVPTSPEFAAALQRGTRSPTGAPGPRYWQQGVRYSIEAEVDPRIPEVKGRERIVYTNRSPDTLPYVTFNFYQNIFRGAAENRSPFNTGGLRVSSVTAQGQAMSVLTEAQMEASRREGTTPTGYFVQGSLARMYLPRPLAPGDSAVFEFQWSHRIPPEGAPRTAYEDDLGGRVLAVAQWYPQIAVYDDVQGHDITQYIGEGEFYLDYGDFDYSVTLPAGWVVSGTGELQNPEQVLAPVVRERLARALQTDSVVRVVTPADVGRATVAGENGRVTWRFRARNVRDVAFAASNRYQWDATRALIPGENGGTRTVAVHALYRAGAPFWERAARHTQHSIAYLSRVHIPYIYPHISVAEGPIYGMEYPMVLFVGRPDDERGLYEVIAHEVAHEWFPMMVGQDEAAFAWMDEGLTTFNEAIAFNDFFPGADHFDAFRGQYLALAGQKGEAPLMRHIDLVNNAQSGVSAYWKPGSLFRSLRTVLGDSVFYQGLRTYEREWLLKHPYPWDFFNTMERVSGRDLDWFWYPWWFTTATLDHAVGSVTPGSGSVQVTVRDLGQAMAPALVVVTTREGQTARGTVTAEQWLGGTEAVGNGAAARRGTRSVTLTIPVAGQVSRVEIDPEEIFPDINRRNNVWTGQ